jgi:uncharacterized protein YbjT (DUF2867 family)
MSPRTHPPALPGLLIAGATGLVGRELTRQAAADAAWRPVHLLVRRALPAPAHTQVLQVDFARLPKLPAVGSACCALGTTIAVAGSQPAFRAVDFDAVVHFARAAHRAGVKRFAMVSALGASARSASFYNRVKGEAEEALAAIGFQTLVIARPSLLAGNREALAQPARRGEQIALALTRPLSGLIPRAWRPIEAATVARAMLRALQERGPGRHVIESGELQSLGQETP